MKIYSNYLPIERYDYFIGDNPKYKSFPATIFNDYVPLKGELLKNPINIFIANEPNELFGIHTWLINNYKKFDLILTWSELVLNNCPNAKLFIHGETNLDMEYIDSFVAPHNRQFEATYLSGILEITEGHKLRQEILKLDHLLQLPTYWKRTLDDFDQERGQRPGYFEEKMTKFGNPIEGEGKKQIWDRKSMFHIAVENTKHNNYFTDKIVDCFATKTIPIYWGAPNIGEYYNKEGIITFNNITELFKILNEITPDDYYNRLEIIEKNHTLARERGWFFKRLENYLDKLIKENGI